MSTEPIHRSTLTTDLGTPIAVETMPDDRYPVRLRVANAVDFDLSPTQVFALVGSLSAALDRSIRHQHPEHE